MYCQPRGMGHQNSVTSKMLFMSSRRPETAVGLLRDRVQSVKGCCCPKRLWLVPVPSEGTQQSSDMDSLFQFDYTILRWWWSPRLQKEFRWSFYKCSCGPQHYSQAGLCGRKENTKLPSKRVGRDHNTEDVTGHPCGLQALRPALTMASDRSGNYLFDQAIIRNITSNRYCASVVMRWELYNRTCIVRG